MNRKPESYFKKIYVIEGFKKYKKFKHKTFLKLLFILFLIFFTILRITNTAQAEDYNTRISVFVKSSTGLSLEELKKNECSSIKFSPKYFYIFGAVPSKILQLKLVQQTTLSGYLKEKNPWVFDVFFRKKHQKPEGEIVDILVYYDEEEEKINSPPKSLEISNVEDTLDSGMDNPLSNSNESYSFIGDSLMNFFHSFQEGFFFIIDFLSSFF